jgi:hypothetical protein
MDCDRCGADNLTDLPVCPGCAREVVFTHTRRQEIARLIYGSALSTSTSTISVRLTSTDHKGDDNDIRR